MEKCKVEGCDNKHKAKGYCRKHYDKFLKYGDPLFTKCCEIKKCKVEGCENKYLAKGYCKKHYYRFKRHGDPLIVQKNNTWKYSGGDSQ